MNDIEFTYDILESIKFGFSMFDIFSQVLLNLFTFFIHTTNQEVYDTLETPINGQTNKPSDNNWNLDRYELAGSACSRYAGFKHFVSSLGPSAL